MQRLPLILGAVFAIFVAAGAMLFTVDQRQYAIVFQLGEIKEVVKEPASPSSGR